MAKCPRGKHFLRRLARGAAGQPKRRPDPRARGLAQVVWLKRRPNRNSRLNRARRFGLAPARAAEAGAAARALSFAAAQKLPQGPRRGPGRMRLARGADEEGARAARRKALAAGLPAPAEPVAVAWRLAKKTTRRGEAWVAQASFEKAEPAKFALSGQAIGVDFNADHLALCRIDRFGNPKHRGLEGRIADIPLDTAGMASEQSDAAIGDACAKIVALARELGAIVVIEKLCFKDKKAQLAEKGAGYSRMLSSLAYSKFHETLERRCEREGAILRRVNPAFTSVIGWAKFSEGFRLTVHQAAACAIARRGMGHSDERLRSKKSFKQGRSALERAAGKAPPPARTRGKHSWADWRRAGALLRAMRAAEWKAARDALGGVGAARGGRRGKRRAWRKNPILGVGGAAKAASPRAP